MFSNSFEVGVTVDLGSIPGTLAVRWEYTLNGTTSLVQNTMRVNMYTLTHTHSYL